MVGNTNGPDWQTGCWSENNHFAGRGTGVFTGTSRVTTMMLAGHGGSRFHDGRPTVYHWAETHLGGREWGFSGGGLSTDRGSKSGAFATDSYPPHYQKWRGSNAR